MINSIYGPWTMSGKEAAAAADEHDTDFEAESEWSADNDEIGGWFSRPIFDARGECVAVVVVNEAFGKDWLLDARARLATKAPEMKEALVALVDSAEDIQDKTALARAAALLDELEPKV